jgi:hypothetical protein
VKILFASGTRVSQAELHATANDGWDLSGSEGKEEFPSDWFAAAELLEMRQGVTPGGCLCSFGGLISFMLLFSLLDL